jgi:hypothetical protein
LVLFRSRLPCPLLGSAGALLFAVIIIGVNKAPVSELFHILIPEIKAGFCVRISGKGAYAFLRIKIDLMQAFSGVDNGKEPVGPS